MNETFAEIKRIEEVASFFSETSELKYLNSFASDEPVKVSEELFNLIEIGLKMSWASEGTFDITATSLGRKDGYKEIVLNRKKKEISFKDKDCKIDLGAFAKGYAIDRAIEVIESHDIKNALVDAGGDMRMIGLPLPLKEWTIGIRNPEKPKETFKIIKFKEEVSIATSGNYLRSHIVDLEGRDPTILSVSVIAPTALEADLLSTTLYNMKKKERLKLLEDFDSVKVLLVREKNSELILEKETREEK